MDWEKIRDEYCIGKSSYKSIAQRYGVSVYELKKHAEKEGWKRPEKAMSQKRREEVIFKVADRLLRNVERAAGELDMYIVKNKLKSKNVEYDSESGKTAKEVLCEKEEMECARSIVDRAELRQLVTALRDIKEIYDYGEKEESRMEKLIRGLTEDNDGGIQ